MQRPTAALLLLLVILTFDPLIAKQMGFPGLNMEHLYVTFGEPTCNDFLRYPAQKKQIDSKTDRQRPIENPTPATVVSVGKNNSQN